MNDPNPKTPVDYPGRTHAASYADNFSIYIGPQVTRLTFGTHSGEGFPPNYHTTVCWPTGSIKVIADTITNVLKQLEEARHKENERVANATRLAQAMMKGSKKAQKPKEETPTN